MRKYFWIVMLCNCIQIYKAAAQDFPKINFSLLNTANGLPTNFVTTVFKDSRGLIWMGTETNGMLRYDGKKIKSYHGINTKGVSILSNYVGRICEDKQGWLWISTMEGLYHMNPTTEETEVYQHNKNDNGSIATNEKPIPHIDSKGRLWITSHFGLQQFDLSTKKFIKYYTPPIANPAWQDEAKAITHIKEDSKKRLWATSAYGIYLVDTTKKVLKPFFTGVYKSVTGIIENADRKLLVSFWPGGIKEFDAESGIYKDIYAPTHVVEQLTEWEDANNKKWMIFFDDKVFTILDPVTYQSTQYPADNTKVKSIKGNYGVYIYIDDDKRAWICTDAGINIIDRKMQQFYNYSLFHDIKKTNGDFGLPRAFLINANGFILSAWARKYLYQYNKNWNLVKRIESIPPGSKVGPNNSIHNIQKDDFNNIWYGTDSGLIKQTGTEYKRYLPADTFANVENQFAARNMLQRPDGKYWVRFADRGLYVFNPVTEKFEKNYLRQFNSTTYVIQYDKTGKLWLGTEDGLYMYQSELDSFVRIPINHYNKVINTYYNIIYNIIFDETNTCWVGTYYGLLKIEPVTHKIEYIIDTDKQSYIVYRQLQDTAGNIWMLSDTEVISYNKKMKTFKYFTKDNGLPENFQGFFGVFNWMNSNSIVMGSQNTVTIFNPYLITTNSLTPKIIFSDISIDGKRITFIDSKKKINVPAGSGNIMLHFALLNYTASQQNELYYRLSAKTEWVKTADGDITLLNLPPGNYTLEVKGECNGDKLNYTTDSINIYVAPLWFQSALFKILGFIALGVSIYLFFKMRIKSVKNSAALKQKISDTEMAALRAQMNPHFMFNCINSIDAFIQSNDKYNATLYLNKFAKLIRYVLESSKENLVYFSKDIETLKLYIELEVLRNEDKFVTRINVEDELMNSDYKVPPLIIQPFVENAILHGLKNKEGNDGIVTVEIKKVNETIQYIITDNGVGRDATAKFRQNKDSHYGMQMSCDRVKLFNGEEIASVRIHDLYSNNIPMGTSIEVNLKII